MLLRYFVFVNLDLRTIRSRATFRHLPPPAPPLIGQN
jgi:hypothetical protein